jgi:hypothetical protein
MVAFLSWLPLMPTQMFVISWAFPSLPGLYCVRMECLDPPPTQLLVLNLRMRGMKPFSGAHGFWANFLPLHLSSAQIPGKLYSVYRGRVYSSSYFILYSLLIFIKWMLYIVSYRNLSFEFQNL